MVIIITDNLQNIRHTVYIFLFLQQHHNIHIISFILLLTYEQSLDMLHSLCYSNSEWQNQYKNPVSIFNHETLLQCSHLFIIFTAFN